MPPPRKRLYKVRERFCGDEISRPEVDAICPAGIYIPRREGGREGGGEGRGHPSSDRSVRNETRYRYLNACSLPASSSSPLPPPLPPTKGMESSPDFPITFPGFIGFSRRYANHRYKIENEKSVSTLRNVSSLMTNREMRIPRRIPLRARAIKTPRRAAERNANPTYVKHVTP